MEQIKDRTLFIECDCHDLAHLYKFSTLAWHNPKEVQVYIENKLNIFLPWYKRLLVALKYVFMPNSPQNGGYDSTLIKYEDLEKLENFFKQSKEEIDECIEEWAKNNG